MPAHPTGLPKINQGLRAIPMDKMLGEHTPSPREVSYAAKLGNTNVGLAFGVVVIIPTLLRSGCRADTSSPTGNCGVTGSLRLSTRLFSATCDSVFPGVSTAFTGCRQRVHRCEHVDPSAFRTNRREPGLHRIPEERKSMPG